VRFLKSQNVPDYITYYFRDGQKPFEVLTDLDPDVAQEILKNDTLWRGDGTYLKHRKEHEGKLRECFVRRGGKPTRKHPIYAILGESPTDPHDLENEYAYKLRLPLDIFPRDEICFTYPDSLYEVPPDDLGRLYLERSMNPTVYTIEELGQVIQDYRVYEYNNHYIEAQIWNEKPILPFAKRIDRIQCISRHRDSDS